MPDCKYCDRSFDSEDRYDEHLLAEHEDELGRIDRRRIQGVSDDDDSGVPTGPAVLIGVIGFALALVVYVVLFLGPGGGGGASTSVNGIQVDQSPTNVGQGDFHGLINVTIGGQQLDFSQSKFQRQAQAFHFEGGNGQVWHGHADGVTLQYAMATLGINVTENTVSYQGETYRTGDPDTTVQVLVNGNPVDPSTYTLSGTPDPRRSQQGDFIKIVAVRDQ